MLSTASWWHPKVPYPTFLQSLLLWPNGPCSRPSGLWLILRPAVQYSILSTFGRHCHLLTAPVLAQILTKAFLEGQENYVPSKLFVTKFLHQDISFNI